MRTWTDALRETDRRAWVPDAAAALAVLVIGALEVRTSNTIIYLHSSSLWIVVPTALAVGLSRRLPSAALALVWLTVGLQVANDTPIMFVQLTLAAVAFGAARWGTPVTAILSGLSIPLAGVFAIRYATLSMFEMIIDSARTKPAVDAIHQLGGTWQYGSALAGMALLGLPWLAGLTLRYSNRAAASQVSQEAAEAEAARAQVETEQAQEIARLRDEQARLARDVHDVVGHSLAVILAQAEAAQFLPDDPEQLKSTMATIATSARGSLQDVRQVLSATNATTSTTAGRGDLDKLVDGIRGSGHQVSSTEFGAVQPLPPELAVVAYRVLQEMLTNAITHGRRDHPVVVERHWPDPRWPGEEDLRIEVSNVAGSPDDTGSHGRGGNGLPGMRRRLEAVGGRLDVRRREERDGITFTATAWVPVRAR